MALNIKPLADQVVVEPLEEEVQTFLDSSPAIVVTNFAAGNPLSSAASALAASASHCCWTSLARKMHRASGHSDCARLSASKMSPSVRPESSSTKAGQYLLPSADERLRAPSTVCT